MHAFAMMERMVAMHESGHTVVALALGIELLKTSVSERRTECGPAFSAAVRGPATTSENAVLGALFALGGNVYEDLDLLYGDDLTPIPLSEPMGSVPTHDDAGNAYRLARVLGGSRDACMTVAVLMDWTRNVVRKNEGPAKAITEALLRSDPLSGGDARTVWLEHGGRHQPASFVGDVLAGVRARGLVA